MHTYGKEATRQSGVNTPTTAVNFNTQQIVFTGELHMHTYVDAHSYLYMQ